MQLKYFGSKAWLAPHMDRLLGDVAVLHSPFFGSGKLEYYLAARRPGLEVRGVDAFEPVANLHRCYLRQDPVFLRSLLRLVGRRVDRRFYSGRLLPGALRGRAGRGRLRVRPAAQQLLDKVGLLRTAAAAGTEQRAASAAATLQRDRAAPGCAGLPAGAALSGAPVHLRQPSLHFPRPQHELLWYERGLVFHTELRDALFASGLPFVVSVNNVPEARELYSGADSITSLCSGKNSSKPELLVVHRGNPVASTGMGGAILLPQQD